MRYLPILVLMIVLPVFVWSQTPTISLTAKNTTPNGSKTYTMSLGASRYGSLGVDSILNEIEIPTLPLPSGVFYIWSVVKPTADEIWLSPRDYRYLRPGTTYREEYNLTVNWDGGSLKWTWPTAATPALVDSAWLTDGYTDFPDNVSKAKIVPNGSLEITNPSITRFKLLVWYNTTSLSVAENTAPSPHLQPQPCTDVLQVRSTSPMSAYIVRDVQGRVVESGMAEGLDVRLITAHWCASTYVLELMHTDGTIARSLFMKQ